MLDEVASIERTPYPRFRRALPLRNCTRVYEPSVDEVTWGAARTSSWSPSDARTCATITAGAIGEFGLQRPGED